MSWSCIDSDGDKELVYDVYFGKNTSPSLIKQGITCNNYRITHDLELDTNYYWKIKVSDSFGASVESKVWNFITSSNPPNPESGDIDIDFSKKFSCSGVKADVMNVGARDVSNVFWNVTITGGVFDRVNTVSYTHLTLPTN